MTILFLKNTVDTNYISHVLGFTDRISNKYSLNYTKLCLGHDKSSHGQGLPFIVHYI